MANLDFMKDPFYAQLIFIIESVICKGDAEAQKKGLRLTDSNIKSALNKARNTPPDMVIVPVESIETKEDMIRELALSIAANRELLAEEIQAEDGVTKIDVSRADWAKAISAVEASLKVRRSNEPGSRFYLDFIHRFVEESRARG